MNLSLRRGVRNAMRREYKPRRHTRKFCRFTKRRKYVGKISTSQRYRIQDNKLYKKTLKKKNLRKIPIGLSKNANKRNSIHFFLLDRYFQHINKRLQQRHLSKRKGGSDLLSDLIKIKSESESDVTWGIGIEHETMILENESTVVNTSALTHESINFNEWYDVGDAWDKILNDPKYRCNKTAPALQLEDANAVLATIAKIKTNTKLDDRLSRAGEINETIAKIPKNTNFDDRLASDLDNFLQKNPKFITDGVDDDKMYRQKVLDKILDGIETDSTLHIPVCEFVTQLFRERTIYQIVQELIMKQNIILRLFEKHLNGTKLKFPCSGSIFPLQVNLNGKQHITHDYTGSYHLNMTLPYKRVDLLDEQKQLISYIQRVEKSKQDIVFTGESYDEWVKRQLANCNDACKYTFPVQLPHVQLPHTHLSADDEYLLLRLEKAFAELHGKSCEELRILRLGTTDLDFVGYMLPTELGVVLPENNTGLILKKNKTQKWCLFTEQTGYRWLKLRTLYRQNKQLNISGKNVIQSDEQGQIIFDHVINTYYQNQATAVMENLVIQYKYRKGTIHFLHRNWAIGIQFILPIILACYSSGDPMSVTGGNMLPALSLRLFISGYCFINLVDVLHYNIPLQRKLSKFQIQHSQLIEMMHTHGIGSKIKDGAEFRCDRRHGLDFGFELRCFDNFDTSHMEVLLELLFLLADHLHTVLEKGFIINPFNHPTINTIIEKICFSGWKTEMTTEYIQLLNEQLQLEVPTNPLPTAYGLCNTIYQMLQRLYITQTGAGKGVFGKYVIRRETTPSADIEIRSLPNINRDSWNDAFRDLIYPRLSLFLREEHKSIKNAVGKFNRQYQTSLNTEMVQNWFDFNATAFLSTPLPTHPPNTQSPTAPPSSSSSP